MGSIFKSDPKKIFEEWSIRRILKSHEKHFERGEQKKAWQAALKGIDYYKNKGKQSRKKVDIKTDKPALAQLMMLQQSGIPGINLSGLTAEDFEEMKKNGIK